VASRVDPGPQRSLADLTVGDRAVVRGVSGEVGLRRRLLELGMLPGTPLEIVRIAPLGDPIEVRLRGYSLSIRRDDARIVAVESAPS
jgi:ferrous iron transport protein A